MADSKNLIICCDGTHNHPGAFTNLWRLSDSFQYVEGKQIRLYLQGVGAAPFFDEWLGSVFGLGLAKYIRTCYKFLLRHYQAGDRIYLFGFSRGAYTIRSLANILDIFGLPKTAIPKEDIPSCAAKVYWVYRFNKIGRYKVFNKAFAATRQRYISKYRLAPCSVELIGVWDTVGSVQIPILRHWYHQVGVTKQTKRAVQAISLDERRRAYYVQFFSTPLVNDSNTVEEVWFAGDHADLGGGHSDNNELSKVSLSWMMKKLPQELLIRGDAPSRDYGDFYLEKLHDMSEKFPFKWLLKRKRVLPHGSAIHVSVLERYRNSDKLKFPHPKLEQNGYLPRNVSNQIFEQSIKSGQPYRFVE